MKTLKYIIYSIFLCFAALGCSNDEIVYTGDPYLHFVNSGEDVMVVLGSEYQDVEIEYGTLSKVSGSHQVKLVVDETSEAKEGVDFDILDGTDDPNGKFEGSFTVRFYESAATTTAKTAIFRLESSDIENSIIDYQTYTINVSLKCPASNMNGTFDNTGWWNGTGVNDIVVDETAHTLTIKDFLVGKDFVLTYDPDTYVVTFDDQSTGYYYSYYGAYIWLKPGPSTTSSFNPCTKTLTLYAYYYMPGVGYWGTKTETFVGQ